MNNIYLWQRNKQTESSSRVIETVNCLADKGRSGSINTVGCACGNPGEIHCLSQTLNFRHVRMFHLTRELCPLENQYFCRRRYFCQISCCPFYLNGIFIYLRKISTIFSTKFSRIILYQHSYFVLASSLLGTLTDLGPI